MPGQNKLIPEYAGSGYASEQNILFYSEESIGHRKSFGMQNMPLLGAVVVIADHPSFDTHFTYNG